MRPLASRRQLGAAVYRPGGRSTAPGPGRALGALALAVLAGCSMRAPARDDAPFQTDRLVYVARGSRPTGMMAEAIVTYRNPRPTTVYLEPCAVKVGDSEVDESRPIHTVIQATTGEHADGVMPEWACVGYRARRPLAPGEVLVDTATLLPYRPPWCELADDDPRGLLRFVYRVFDRQGGERDEAGLLPLEERWSNRFRLVCER